MNRKRFLCLGSSTALAMLFLPKTSTPADADRSTGAPRVTAVGLGQAATIFCGTSTNANGRFRHYLVDGRRLTERVQG